MVRCTLQIASPACTEIEMKMMNWLARLLQLPEEFMFSENKETISKGGGVIQVIVTFDKFVGILWLCCGYVVATLWLFFGYSNATIQVLLRRDLFKASKRKAMTRAFIDYTFFFIRTPFKRTSRLKSQKKIRTSIRTCPASIFEEKKIFFFVFGSKLTLVTTKS